MFFVCATIIIKNSSIYKNTVTITYTRTIILTIFLVYTN